MVVMPDCHESRPHLGIVVEVAVVELVVADLEEQGACWSSQATVRHEVVQADGR